MPPPSKKPKLGKTLMILTPILIAVGTMQYKYNQQRLNASSSFLPIRTISCWNCEGKGQVVNPFDRNALSACEVCYGVGSRMVRIDPVSQTVCTGCSGMGFVRDDELELTVACPHCRGFGAMRKPRVEGILETRFTSQADLPPGPRMNLLPSASITNEVPPDLLLPPKPRPAPLPQPEPAAP